MEGFEEQEKNINTYQLILARNLEAQCDQHCISEARPQQSVSQPANEKMRKFQQP
jgi:hypothetical protein